jgi:hypothetical protein
MVHNINQYVIVVVPVCSIHSMSCNRKLQPSDLVKFLHPSSKPPYHAIVMRIIHGSDEQAGIFLEKKLRDAAVDEQGYIVDIICSRGLEFMIHWWVGDVSRILEY